MIVYSLIVLAAAVACAVLGRSIHKGNATLINCYRPERVKDKPCISWQRRWRSAP